MSAGRSRKLQELTRIRDEAVDRISKYQAAMKRMKDLSAELGAALTAGDRQRALKIIPETVKTIAEVDRLNLEESVYNTRLARLLMELEDPC